MEPNFKIKYTDIFKKIFNILNKIVLFRHDNKLFISNLKRKSCSDRIFFLIQIHYLISIFFKMFIVCINYLSEKCFQSFLKAKKKGAKKAKLRNEE